MRRKFRLATVLRARKAQEDAARSAVSRARGQAAAAQLRHYEQERALAARQPAEGASATAYVAAQASLQGLAADVAAAAALSQQAEASVQHSVDALADAAARHQSVRTLADRHAEAVRAGELAANQRVIDEIASTNRRAGTQDGPR